MSGKRVADPKVFATVGGGRGIDPQALIMAYRKTTGKPPQPGGIDTTYRRPLAGRP
jgi:hypothetical protein